MIDAIKRRFGYDATTDRGRRKITSAPLQSEDAELTTAKRKSLLTQARDIGRNFSIAAWAIRKHLDFVAAFRPQARTPDAELNNRIELWLRNWQKAESFDASGRHPLRRFLRLAEARRTVDGDVFILKLADGTVQAIEGDRIRNPAADAATTADDLKNITFGVRTAPSGRPLAYAVHSREGTGFKFERWIAAANILPLAYFERFDQTRGISPLASALDPYRDLYESFDYALAKAKIAQMFGLVLYRDALDSPAPITEEQAATDNEPAGKYKIDFGRGPVLLDLDPGDRAEFLENKTPPVEFQQFTAIIISAALKALDIPFSFYDEAYTNFFGSRAALILYLKSARAKQEDLRDLLDSLTKWRLVIALTNRELELPPGIGPDDLQIDWIPDGTPWWNPQQEISADLQAIGGTLRTRAEIRRERFGDDWYDVLAELKREEEAIKEADLTWMDSPAALITQPIPEDPPPKNGNK